MLENYLLLRYLEGIGLRTIKKYLEEGWSAAKIIKEHRRRIKNYHQAWREVKRELARSDELGVRLVPYSDSEYPASLREIADPPFILYVKGRRLPNFAETLAIVGTRKISPYGREVLRYFVPPLCQAQLTIVSGLARGVDQLAHQLVLENQGATVAILGTGLDIVYPPESKTLFEKIGKEGTLVSEFPFGFEPTQYSFPARNRLIAGFSKAVLIVEAPVKSGALITAGLALEQNREVFVVPGSIFAANSSGNHELIRDGASLVTEPEELLKFFNRHLHKTDSIIVNKNELKSWRPEEREIYQLLQRASYRVDEIIRLTHLPPAVVNSTLTLLEIKGKVRELGPGEYSIV